MTNQENEIIQNIDLPNANPLNQEVKIKTNDFKNLLKNKKALLIISLFGVFVLLMLLSLIVKITPKVSDSLIKISQNASTQTPTSSVSSNNIPAQYQENFNKIDSEINTQNNFLPPEIDPDLGSK